MTVRGSVSKMIGRHLSQIDKMNKECVEDSLDTLAKLAAGFTPVDSGKLAGNWKKTPVKRNAKGEYSGRIYNDLPYAAMVEFGTAPHIITPNTKQALHWEGAAHPVKRVNHPGTTGAHMASKAAAVFQASGLDRSIAEQNVRKHLK